MRKNAYSRAMQTLERWTEPVALGPYARRALIRDMRVVMRAIKVQADELERVKASRAKIAFEWAKENRKLEAALRTLSTAYASTKGKRQ